MATPPPRPTNKQQELHTAARPSTATRRSSPPTAEQGYTRYLRPGDRVSATTVIESISEQKATALGIGYFIDTRTDFRDQNGEEVGWMTFRVLKFKPQRSRPQRRGGRRGAPPSRSRMRRAARPRQRLVVGGRRARRAADPEVQRAAASSAIRRARCAASASRRSGRDRRVPGHAAPSTATWCCTTRRSPATSTRSPWRLIELEEGTRLVSNIVGCEPERGADRHAGRARDRERRRRAEAAALPAGRVGRANRWISSFTEEQTMVRDLAREILEQGGRPPSG